MLQWLPISPRVKAKSSKGLHVLHLSPALPAPLTPSALATFFSLLFLKHAKYLFGLGAFTPTVPFAYNTLHTSASLHLTVFRSLLKCLSRKNFPYHLRCREERLDLKVQTETIPATFHPQWCWTPWEQLSSEYEELQFWELV